MTLIVGLAAVKSAWAICDVYSQFVYENLRLGDDLESVRSLYPELDIDTSQLEEKDIPALAYVWGYNNMEDRPFLHLYFVHSKGSWILHRIVSYYFYPDPIEFGDLIAAAKSKYGEPIAQEYRPRNSEYFQEIYALAWGERNVVRGKAYNDSRNPHFLVFLRRKHGGIRALWDLSCPLQIEK